MPGYIEPQELPASVANDQKRIQKVKRHRWNHEQIDRGNRIGMIAQKCFPALRWWSTSSNHVFRDCRLGDFKTQLQKLAVDPGGTP